MAVDISPYPADHDHYPSVKQIESSWDAKLLGEIQAVWHSDNIFYQNLATLKMRNETDDNVIARLMIFIIYCFSIDNLLK